MLFSYEFLNLNDKHIIQITHSKIYYTALKKIITLTAK
jgi:hypothetical protein